MTGKEYDGVIKGSRAEEIIWDRDAEIERLQDYKRKQMIDIMDLGQQVGKLEVANAKLRAELKSAEAVCDSYAVENQQFYDEIERLRAALAKAQDYIHRGEEKFDAGDVETGRNLIGQAYYEAAAALADEQKP